jgi:hypothetical protein
MAYSRRSILKALSAFPVAVSLRSFAFSIGGPSTTLTISISGPLAFVMDGNDVTVYAPQVPNHFGRVATSDGEAQLEVATNYQLSGLPDPTGETSFTLPPLTLNLPKTPRDKQEFSLRLKRPDAIVGIHPMDVFVSNAPERKQSLPTGLRFIYKNVSANPELTLSAKNSSAFQPNFITDKAAHPSHLEMEIEFETQTADHCHIEARASFGKLLELFPGHGIQSIRFAEEDPSCSTHGASVHLETAGYMPTQTMAHKLNVNMKVGSCMSPVILIR